MTLVHTHAYPTCLVTVSSPVIRLRFWVTVWTLYEGARLAESTLTMRLRHIDRFYVHCDERFGLDALDNALGDKDPARVLKLVESFYVLINSKKSRNTSDEQCWDAVSNFIHFFANQWAVRDAVWNNFKKAVALPGGIRSSVSAKIRFVRALPSPVLDDLFAKALPLASQNPFKEQSIQFRNWILVMLMVLYGLRRGETLLLTVDSLNQGLNLDTGELKFWLNVTNTGDDDDRSTPPSIKTAASHRQIPISEEMAEAIENYISEFRVVTGDHRFLITERGGKALSVSSVDKTLRQLSLALSPSSLELFRSQTKKRYISSHDLRHTCACIRYNLFTTSEDAARTMENMCEFFGWEPNSNMPNKYSRGAIQGSLEKYGNETFEKTLSRYRTAV